MRLSIWPGPATVLQHSRWRRLYRHRGASFESVVAIWLPCLFGQDGSGAIPQLSHSHIWIFVARSERFELPTLRFEV